MSKNFVRRKLAPFQLVALIFLTVSGGPYGLEPLLTYAGRNGALLLLCITPLLWDVPTIFAVLELNSMMPVTGGYYQWVKRAMGMRWAFYEGWWTWLYTFVDLAIYPVLFVSYASWFFPELINYRIPVCIIIIWISAFLNILGIMPVGKISVILGAVVITPFILLFFTFLFKHHGNVNFPAMTFKGSNWSSIGMGLYTIMWNYIGWDNVTTYAQEVERPVKSYLISILISFLLIFILYFVTVYVSSQSLISPALLVAKGFPVLGLQIGGYWLGSIISLGGMASTLGLYSAVLLSVSRVPEAMSIDGLLPTGLNKLHPKYRSPYISIITCSLIISVMIVWTFEELLIIDITLYGAALFLEFIALIIMRKKFPFEERPFRIPLNKFGLSFMALLPFSVYIIALCSAFRQSHKTFISLSIALLLLISSEIVWYIIKWFKSRKVFSSR